MIVGVDLAVDIQLPYPARNELGVLRAEIENENFGMHVQRYK